MSESYLARRSRAAHRANPLFRLDWPQFWLLTGILGGILALAGVVMLIELSSQ
jgi:hypothetical protein